MSTTTTTTGYRFTIIRQSYPYPVYSITRKGETEPFGTVQQTRDSGWTHSAAWSARSIIDESVRVGDTSREKAAKALEHRMLPQEERDRLEVQWRAEGEAERQAADERIAQEKLDQLRSPEHQAAALTEAFHVLFDIKEAAAGHDPGWYYTYEAINRLKDIMEANGIEVPKRYDGDGRTVENGGLS